MRREGLTINKKLTVGCGPIGSLGFPPNRRLSGAKGNRTPDPFHAMEVLYQLSYSPIGVETL